MAQISREAVEAVRERTDIVEVVSRHVQLKRRGQSWVGLCPFHQERSPSFNVVPGKGLFYCFGCQEGGDVFKFLMLIEGVSFPEAVKELAGPAGVTIEERELTADERARMRARATLYDVHDAAADFFASRLWTSTDAEAARDYLARRALTEETQRRARLGWAPASWNALTDHLQERGFSPALLLAAGLARRSERTGNLYDTFRERVIIPIRDERDRVIAFGGRVLSGDGPKYINSPESDLYKKSSVLYGLDYARRYIGQKDRALLVEGYFDVLSLQQAGFGEALATCGTALTADHLQRLKRLTGQVIVLTDADEAGQRAAERTLPLFTSVGMQSWRLQLPGAKDPDELIREEGTEAFEAAMESREPLLRWVTRRRLRANGYDAAARSRTLDEVIELSGPLDAVQAAEVAGILNVPETTVLERARSRARGQPQHAAPPSHAAGWRPHREAVHLLWLLIHRLDAVGAILLRADPALLGTDEVLQRLVPRLLEGEPVPRLLDDERDEAVRRALSAIVARAELYDDSAAAIGMCGVLGTIQKRRFEAHITECREAIRAARQLKDPTALAEAAQQIAAYSQRQRDLDDALRREDVDACLTHLAPGAA